MTDCQRHPYTGRFLAHDCEVDCLTVCAGLCGTVLGEAANNNEIADEEGT